MITDKASFQAVETLIQSDGWKLFAKDLEQMGKACMNKAVDNIDRDERIRYLDEYRAYRRVLETIYGEYKSEYDKYKGAE